MSDLTGKVALVTGGSKNIGRAVVLQLAEAGADVAIVTQRDIDAANSVVQAAREHGVGAEAYLIDITDEAKVGELMRKVEQRFGRLDILVNNAALRTEVAFADMSLDEWHRVLAVTLDGAFLCSRAALPLLVASGAGTIVNIGGLSAYTGASHRAHVVAAKAGLGGLTRALAVELAPQSITVNLVSPGLIDTQRVGASPRHHKSHDTLTGRRGTPEEIASMVRYLAGPAARYITGQALHVNGGAYLG